MPTSWTDDPVTTTTPIKAVHINELRTALNGLRANADLNPYPWTDGSTVTTNTPIRAEHFSEIRRVIQELWLAKGLGHLPDWFIGSPPSRHRAIKASDMNDLRQWTNDYESSTNDLDPQGIVSLWYDPNGPYIIDSTWANDVLDIKPNCEKLPLRLIAQSKASDNSISPQDYQGYNDSLDVWRLRGFSRFSIVLPGEFDRTNLLGPSSTYCPNLPLTLGDSGLLNSYIDHYSLRARAFVYEMRNSGIEAYWIWNEPNLEVVEEPNNNCNNSDHGRGALWPGVFEAFVHTTCKRIREWTPNATLYMGSINVIKSPDNPDGARTEQYLEGMYTYLESKNIDGLNIPYGWNAISLNILGPVDSDFVNDVFTRLDSCMKRHHDASPLIVGEWGMRNPVVTESLAVESFDAIRAKFLTMYFYSHNIEIPVDLGSFGARAYTHGGSGYVLQQALPWYSLLLNQIYPNVP